MSRKSDEATAHALLGAARLRVCRSAFRPPGQTEVDSRQARQDSTPGTPHLAQPHISIIAVSADKPNMKTHREPRNKAHSGLCYFCCDLSCDFSGGATVTTQQCFQRIAAPPLNRSNTRFTRRFVSRPRPPNHCINHLGGRGRDPKLEAIKTKSGAGQLGEQGANKTWVTGQ